MLLLKIAENSPQILNMNSRFIRSLLDTVCEVDKYGNSAIFYASQQSWKINYISRTFILFAEVAPELKTQKLFDFLSNK